MTIPGQNVMESTERTIVVANAHEKHNRTEPVVFERSASVCVRLEQKSPVDGFVDFS